MEVQHRPVVQKKCSKNFHNIYRTHVQAFQMKVAGLFKYVSLLAAMFHIEQLFCKLQEQQFADGQQNKFS